MQRFGLLGQSLNLTWLIEDKARFLASHMSEQNLALNFLANIRKLSQGENHAIQTSGLVHLLAISGGQVAPIARSIAALVVGILFALLVRHIPPRRLMGWLGATGEGLGFTIAFGLSFVFGCTGALLRTCFMDFLAKNPLIKYLSLICQNVVCEIDTLLFTRFFALGLFSILFGSVFHNFSFLLSAIGAYCCGLSMSFTENLYRTSVYNQRLWFGWLKNILAGALTCLFVGLVLFPFSLATLHDSLMANLFAIPLVTFAIAPLSILAVILPTGTWVSEISLLLLDKSLAFFSLISETFANPEAKLLTSKENPLFQEFGRSYLSLCFLILFVVGDWREARPLLRLQSEVIKLRRGSLK